MQRICVFILLALTGLTLATQKKAHAVILIQIIISCAGLFFASRQLWLQSLPLDSAPACMPGLDVLIRYFPWKSVVHALFWGTGECAADSGWSFLGINMPGWTALYFLFMIVASCILYISLKKTVTDGN
jgi:disulfide bond formation protein DsbB